MIHVGCRECPRAGMEKAQANLPVELENRKRHKEIAQ